MAAAAVAERSIVQSVDEGLAQFDKFPARGIDALVAFDEHEAEIHDIAEQKIRTGANPVQITGADVQSRPRAGGG